MENKELTGSYTKGEWYLQEYTDAYTNIIRCNNGKHETLYIASTGQGSTPENRANAKLMAAAPDLLEALQEIIAITDRDHVAWIKAKSAIEKAIGGEVVKTHLGGLPPTEPILNDDDVKALLPGDLNLAVIGHGKPERAMTGPVWVKAVDRLPAQQTQLHLKIDGTKSIGYFNKLQNAFIDDSGDTFAPYYVEWLDESGTAYNEPASPPSDAVEFGDWLATERWQPRINTEWARYETIYSDVSVKTTAELYDIFKKEGK